jgi:hypothetical protein
LNPYIYSQLWVDIWGDLNSYISSQLWVDIWGDSISVCSSGPNDSNA